MMEEEEEEEKGGVGSHSLTPLPHMTQSINTIEYNTI